MRLNDKAMVLVAFFLGFGAISPVAAQAENSPDCKLHKDTTYCSTYNVTEMATSRIESNEDASTDILILLNVMNTAEYDIRYYVTFKFIQSLANIEEGFEQTEDYRQLKETLFHQMIKYVSLTDDEIRPQIYFAYLHYFIEPSVKLPKSENIPQIEPKHQLEERKLLTKCLVENDIPFLPVEEIGEFAKLKTCVNG